MQDSTPVHTTAKNYQWLEEHFPSYWRKREWPGNSPNLNPIENLWSIMKQKVAEMEPATTILQLQSQLQSAWAGLSPNLLEDLIMSMPKRMKMVIQLKGGYIGK